MRKGSKWPVLAIGVGIIAAVSLVVGRAAWVSVESWAASGSMRPNRIQEADVVEVSFRGTIAREDGQTVVFRDAEGLIAVLTMYKKLEGTRSAASIQAGIVAGRSKAPQPACIDLLSSVLFRDGTRLNGRWTVRDEPYFVRYLPNGTLADIDPGAWYHHEEAAADEANLKFVRKLMAACTEPAAEQPGEPDKKP